MTVSNTFFLCDSSHVGDCTTGTILSMEGRHDEQLKQSPNPFVSFGWGDFPVSTEYVEQRQQLYMYEKKTTKDLARLEVDRTMWTIEEEENPQIITLSPSCQVGTKKYTHEEKYVTLPTI